MSSMVHPPATASGPPKAPAALGVRLETVATADREHTVFLDELHESARNCEGRVPALLELARRLGQELPLPQQGHTLQLWQSLATLGAANLTAARIIEPHLDALAILDQAGQTGAYAADSTWGVFAAQGPGQQLLATPAGDSWSLEGLKPWCSLADDLSHALVTARTEAGMQLFAIDLRHPGVTTTGRPWVALGLPAVPSRGLSLVNVPATAVGGPGWYTQRPGFSWGGVGVAAIWHGAATALARRLHRHCLSREPDQIALWHFGSADQALWSAKAAFQSAAAVADRIAADTSATHDADMPALVAARVRARVVSTAESILSLSGHGMGPEPLAFEAEHAQRVADLELYLRQDHAERSLAAHGKAVLAAAAKAGAGAPPW